MQPKLAAGSLAYAANRWRAARVGFVPNLRKIFSNLEDNPRGGLCGGSLDHQAYGRRVA